jgi:hypothetical protein
MSNIIKDQEISDSPITTKSSDKKPVKIDKKA